MTIDPKSIYTFNELKEEVIRLRAELAKHKHDNLYQSTMPVWEDIRCPATSAKAPASAFPGWSIFDKALYAWEYSATKDQRLHFDLQMSHRRKPGTRIRLHIHWSPVDNSAGNVVWMIHYSWADIDEAFPAVANETVVVAAGETTRLHQRTHLVELDGTDHVGLSSMVKITLYRLGTDPLDTYGAGAYLHELDAHYISDNRGSRHETEKY